MNILLVHNYYQFRGGEDAVVEADKALLESHGHTVVPYFIHSTDIAKRSILSKLLIPLQIPFHMGVYRDIQKVIRKQKIDVVHIHNFWPLISPSVLFACNRLKTPWVQTIHNYRYIVPDAILNPDDVDAHRRLTIKKRSATCFKDSLILTQLYRFTAWLVCTSGCVNRGSGVLQVLNQFGYDIHAQRFDKDHLRIRGNFLPDSEVAFCVPQEKREKSYLFLGRLSDEKGVEVLCKAWREAKISGTLKIGGTGPLEQNLRDVYGNDSSIEFLGFVSGPQKYTLLAEATALIVPSVWQENFPVTVMEANFCGTPVFASRVGGLPEMIEEGKTGYLFESGSVSELALLLQKCSQNQSELHEMGQNARKYAEEHFTEEKSYEHLMKIYRELMNS